MLKANGYFGPFDLFYTGSSLIDNYITKADLMLVDEPRKGLTAVKISILTTRATVIDT